MRKLLYNATIINEEEIFVGHLTINDNGKIEDVQPGNPNEDLLNKYNNNSLNLQKHWLIPGIIDTHVHFREPGATHKATIYSESRAAAAGGVTSYLEMPNTSPATTTIQALENKFHIASNTSLVNYSFFIGATTSNIDVLKQIDYTRVPGVKLFMGSSTGGMLVDNEETLAQIFKLETLIAAHCEDEHTITRNLNAVKSLYKDSTPPIDLHSQIRSVLACALSTNHAILLAKKYNTRLHLLHITTAQEIEMIRNAPKNITAEVCLPHLLFCDEDYPKLGTKIKCNPSIKSNLQRKALRNAIKSNIISTVSTDHAPHTLDEKNKDLFNAPSGIPMIQYSLVAMLDLAIKGEWTPEMVVQKMCHQQADIYRIEKRGYIRKGYAADLVEIDPTATTHIQKADKSYKPGAILSKCAWSPLEGKTLQSRVERTWVNGIEVYSAEKGISTSQIVAQPLKFQQN